MWVVDSYYPKPGNGCLPIGLERTLGTHFLQYWFNLADLSCKKVRYGVAGLRRFAGIDLGGTDVPSLLRFRHMLEQHKLGENTSASLTLCRYG